MTDQPIAVYYDFEARLWGQRYLLIAHEDAPGYACLPVTDPT